MRKYFALVLVSVFFMAGCSEMSENPSSSLEKTSLEKNSFNFGVHLTGDYEVPPVDTRAQGQVLFRLSDDGTELYYKLIVANIENVTASHIHLAPPGVNGGVVVLLFQGPLAGRFSGVLAEGVITSANLVGALSGGTLDDLLDHIENNNAYVNVHTTQNPGGEVRGDL